MTRKVAFITGASRGIGRACAVELADAGFDVAITARTVTEGERREHSPTIEHSDTSPLPGSLEKTAAVLQEKGVKVMVVPADLLDAASLGVAVTEVLHGLGRIDVVVHNARYVGAGHMDLMMDTPVELVRRHMEGNFFAPLIINRLVLPQMVANGGGIFANITSPAAYSAPKLPAGSGGWGLSYGATKAAFQRIAGFLKAELQGQGVRAFNVSPGAIRTDQDFSSFGFGADGRAPPEVPARVVRWLCTSPEADAFNGQTIEAQHFCHERRLMPEWGGPVYRPGESRSEFDLAGYNIDQISKAAAAAAAGP